MAWRSSMMLGIWLRSLTTALTLIRYLFKGDVRRTSQRIQSLWECGLHIVCAYLTFTLRMFFWPYRRVALKAIWGHRSWMGLGEISCLIYYDSVPSFQNSHVDKSNHNGTCDSSGKRIYEGGEDEEIKSSSAPPVSSQYLNLGVTITKVSSRNGRTNSPLSFTLRFLSSLPRIWGLGMALPDS